MDHQRNEAAQGKNARQGTAEDPFAEQSAVAPIAVPPEPVQEVGDGIGEEPAPQDQQVIEVPPNQPPPPTRATFVGEPGWDQKVFRSNGMTAGPSTTKWYLLSFGRMAWNVISGLCVANVRA
jgi:hypothetical protein